MPERILSPGALVILQDINRAFSNSKAKARAQTNAKGLTEYQIGCLRCGSNQALTRHHLVPRALTKDQYHGRTVKLCRDCHAKLHASFDNWELANEFGTVEKLKALFEHQPSAKG